MLRVCDVINHDATLTLQADERVVTAIDLCHFNRFWLNAFVVAAVISAVIAIVGTIEVFAFIHQCDGREIVTTIENQLTVFIPNRE